MTTLAVVAGIVGVVAVAGLLRDRLRGRRPSEPPNGMGSNDPTLRYHRDVADSTNQHGIVGGPF
jgi:hypothetical protein